MGMIGWYKRDPAAALRGMRSLTPEQRGIYNTVLDLIYDSANELIDDDRFVAGNCNCDIRVYRRVKKHLIEAEKLYVAEGFLRNYTADEAVANLLAKHTSNRNAALIKHGKLKPEDKKNKDLADAHAHADAHAKRVPYKIKNKKESESNTDSESIIRDSESDTKHSPDEPGGELVKSKKSKYPAWSSLPKNGVGKAYPEAFDHFWETYPKDNTSGKKPTYRHWVKLANDPNVGDVELWKCAKRYRAEIESSGRYPKGAGNWLSEEIYLNYMTGAQQPTDDLFAAPNQTNGATNHVDGSIVTYTATNQRNTAARPAHGKGIAAAGARCLGRR